MKILKFTFKSSVYLKDIKEHSTNENPRKNLQDKWTRDSITCITKKGSTYFSLTRLFAMHYMDWNMCEPKIEFHLVNFLL